MEIVISNSSDKPIYEQISSQIRDSILTGALAPGEALPSIRTLAASLRISAITTKRAYSDLEAQGYIETVPGKDEYYITHKQCGICKLTKRKHCEEITKHLCMMDYYTFEMQGAVLDRTKTLGYGDDECNFHLMSKERANEIGFVQSPNAK